MNFWFFYLQRECAIIWLKSYIWLVFFSISVSVSNDLTVLFHNFMFICIFRLYFLLSAADSMHIANDLIKFWAQLSFYDLQMKIFEITLYFLFHQPECSGVSRFFYGCIFPIIFSFAWNFIFSPLGQVDYDTHAIFVYLGIFSFIYFPWWIALLWTIFSVNYLIYEL